MNKPTDRSRVLACRRDVLCAGSAAALATFVTPAQAEDDDEERSKRPQPGDVLVFSTGDRQGQVAAPKDVEINDNPVIVWPADPKTKTPRDGSRFNQVLLVKVDPGSLPESARDRSADGVFAYSAVCTHQQCTVVGWREEKHTLYCPCHESEFEPVTGKNVFGPATRPLAQLPLKMEGGTMVVSHAFIGKLGAPAAT
ncbi:MAG: Rieske (2Fe-2S) protein [Acetobacteraceae bacterium]|nr:Rieske (2Fe-2S) protein [Acetobacteraceae bacterium]MBV8589380.1 Rieske (2Fe-2S) protein [Acetobacteraceae bacterium]